MSYIFTVSSTAKVPEKHSPRVLAWLSSAINPWIDVAEFENRYTAQGSVSYRQRRRQLEHLRLLRAQLAPGGRLVLDDLERFDGRVRDWEASHDDAIRKIGDEANAAFDALTKAPSDFQALLHEIDVGRGLFRKEAESAASDERELGLDMAENIVNAQGELSSRYVDSAFWNRWRDKLLAFRRGLPFQKLDEARAELQRVNTEAISRLTELRWRLVDEFDVPPSGEYGRSSGWLIRGCWSTPPSSSLPNEVPQTVLHFARNFGR